MSLQHALAVATRTVGALEGAWVFARLCFLAVLSSPGLGRDSAAPAIFGFAAGFLGLTLGCAAGWCLASGVERLIQHRVGSRPRVGLAVLFVTVLSWWGFSLLGDAALELHGTASGQVEAIQRLQTPQPPLMSPMSRLPCEQPPPVDARELRLWQQECR